VKRLIVLAALLPVIHLAACLYMGLGPPSRD
jgi:hypothetical protein